MKRPFLERLFIVLWCLWGILGLLTLFGLGWASMPIGDFLIILAAVLGITGIPVTLLQYLVLGFFNPLLLFRPKA